MSVNNEKVVRFSFHVPESTKTVAKSKAAPSLCDRVTSSAANVWNSISSHIIQTLDSMSSCLHTKKPAVAVQQKNAIPTYSLDEFLAMTPKMYVSSICEAIELLVPKQKRTDLRFKPLEGGHSTSKILRFDAGDKKYVLRLLDEEQPFEKRVSEIAAHKNASDLNVAPKLVYSDKPHLVIVMEYIEGRIFAQADLDNKEIVTKLMQALKKFHLNSSEQNMSKQTRADKVKKFYAINVKNGDVFPTGFDKIHKEFQEEVASLTTKRTPTHGDLNPRNILIGKDGNVYPIDWAETRIDNPFFDIGWLAGRTAASDTQIKNMLEGYLGREPNQSEIKQTLLGRDHVAMTKGNRWFNLQKERDQKKLDELLESPIKVIDECVSKNIGSKQLSPRELTLGALGWVQELIHNRYHVTAKEFLRNVQLKTV